MAQKINPEHWCLVLNGTLPRPTGENFFLFQVRLDTPTDVLWDDGFDVIGNWKSCCRTFNAKLLLETNRDRHVRLAVYQGDEARRQITRDLVEERRYRREQMQAQFL